MRILSIDHGTKRIGLAFYDSDVNIPMPIEKISSRKRGSQYLFSKISDIIINRKVTHVVCGWPAYLSGHKSVQCIVVEKFLNRLKSMHPHIVIHKHKEYFSSILSSQLYGQSDDSISAFIILQSFLSSLYS